MMLKHILLWLFVSLFIVLLLPGMFNPQTYLTKIKTDQNRLADEIGGKSAGIIIAKADRIYNQMFEDSGFHPWINKRYRIGQNDHNELLEETSSDKAAGVAKNYITTFLISMYEAIYRLTQLMYWATFALPFVVAAAFDGLMQRKVRNESFQYSSPSRYNTMWHFLIALASLTFIYCTTPFSMPAAAYPMLVFAAAMGIREMLANLQRSA